MQPEPEPLVQRPQPRAVRIAIQTQISLTERPCAIDGPLEQRIRDSLAREGAPDRKTMHER
jgi:hypothetical protein